MYPLLYLLFELWQENYSYLFNCEEFNYIPPLGIFLTLLRVTHSVGFPIRAVIILAELHSYVFSLRTTFVFYSSGSFFSLKDVELGSCPEPLSSFESFLILDHMNKLDFT